MRRELGARSGQIRTRIRAAAQAKPHYPIAIRVNAPSCAILSAYGSSNGDESYAHATILHPSRLEADPCRNSRPVVVARWSSRATRSRAVLRLTPDPDRPASLTPAHGSSPARYRSQQRHRSVLETLPRPRGSTRSAPRSVRRVNRIAVGEHPDHRHLPAVKVARNDPELTRLP